MKLPLLATRGVIVFPGNKIQLEVGRPESIKALDISSLTHDYSLIISSQKNVLKEKIENIEDIYKFGTLVTFKIEKVHESGTKSVVVNSIERVKIASIETSKGFIEADFKIVKSKTSDEEKEKAFINNISKTLDKALGSMINIPKNVLSSLAAGISASDLADVIAHYLPVTFSKKQKVLSALDVNKRLEIVLELLNQESKINEIEKDIDQSVRKTIDNQHKEFLLRERMKAIKEELGDIPSKESELDKWKKMIEEDKKFPEYIKESVREEIRKYESTPPMAAESNVIKGYLDWIFSLPWDTYSNDSEDFDNSKNVLDKYHFGLEKVKERIIEHLAVKMHTKNNDSPIITLVGPPGVGKTSLAKSIAEAVGREFIKVSLGGVKDESEIRGHRRTYVGAMPGKIIQALKKAKTSNPVILLDEIDKMSADYKGDPTSAMLEVLDPEQNKKFQDHYIEIEYDLSKVMFIATANYLQQIPRPLLDRVETIFLEQYTSEEKLQIAKNHIIPRVIKEHGLNKTNFKISDVVIQYVIDKYTREAGVRGLHRVLSKIARKIVVMKLEKKVNGTTYTITLEGAKKLLGKEEVYKEKLKGRAEVGLVNGMYYSEVGGGTLPIEVTTYPSKNGGLKVTGSIKEVMAESLKIAIGYIRSHAKKFGIKFDWEKNTIQVHVPEGATPKDGPSAGTAFATAVISALTKKPVSKEIALTGEITLRGKVLPIGGLKEKTIGSVELGVKKIFIPEVNRKDFDDLSKKVKEKASLIFVSDYKEIFNEIFK